MRSSFGRTSIVPFILALFPSIALSSTIVLDDPTNFANPDDGEDPAVSTDSASTIGAGSWRADPDANQHLVYLQGDQPGPHESNGQKEYSEPGENPRLLFPEEQKVTLENIKSFSWDTRTEGDVDWFVDVFTRPGDEPDSWYGKNFDFVVDEMPSDSVQDGFLRHTFNREEGRAIDNLWYDDSSVKRDYSYQELESEFGSEEIWFLSLSTATNYENFDGFIDNFQFSYEYDGTVYNRQVDLEPKAVPTPTTISLLLGGLIIAGATRIVRK